MKKYLGYILFVLTCIVGITSCDSTEVNDNQKPTIDNILLSSSNLFLGDTLYLGYEFGDDQYLSTYFVSIDTLENQSYTDSSKIAYTKKIVKSFNKDEYVYALRKDTVIIPKTLTGNRLPIAHGKYLITISCLDKKGNETVIELPDTLILNPLQEEAK